LIFELEVGSKVAAKVQAQYADGGRRPPNRAGNVPEIDPSLQLWWTAWQDLSTDRPVGGLVTIPFGAIASYADRYQLDLGLTKMIVWGLDEVFLEHERERINRAREAAKTG
jgi:hypothetical protein